MAQADQVAPALASRASILWNALPDMPVVVWMVFLTLAIGFAGQLSSADLIQTFNVGFGRALGEFALILIPSFVLAATLSRSGISSPGVGRIAAGTSPVAGAGMICPDTAYAALSPAAAQYKMHVAFGAYAGFKLLYPAGPLLVATGLGVMGSDGLGAELAVYGFALLLPLLIIGFAWVRLFNNSKLDVSKAGNAGEQVSARSEALRAFAPFILLTALLVVGAFIGETGNGLVDFLFQPKGALLAAALFALAQTTPSERRECWDSSVNRTGSLLLVIGAASAFGATLTKLVPVHNLLPDGTGIVTLIGLFLLTAAFKVIQGSSMATFAAVAPVAAPIVAASEAHPIAAVYAICLGSFVAILPNDSYYWLVRRDIAEHDPANTRAVWVLSSGVTAQAVIGLLLLLTVVFFWPQS